MLINLYRKGIVRFPVEEEIVVQLWHEYRADLARLFFVLSVIGVGIIGE